MKRTILLFFLAAFFASCSEDNSYAPPYQMDFMDIRTNSLGQGWQAIADNDEVLTLTNPIQGLQADTVFRYVAVYTRDGENIQLYQKTRALYAKPSALEPGETLHTDPVKVQSVWKVARYINCTLLIPQKDKTHTLGIIDQGVTTNSQGNRIARILLFHDADNDTQAFSGTAYLSIPLQGFAQELTAGQDSIYLSIHTTAKDSVATYKFAY